MGELGKESRRSIPARAGERSTVGTDITSPAVNPRACGGEKPKTTKIIKGLGQSPRVRGRDLAKQLGPGLVRSIPARAGESLYKRQSLLYNDSLHSALPYSP